MNATLLDTQVNSKDLKVLSKNNKDIKENETGDFFENIVQSMLGEGKNDKTKDFLLEKFLNLPENSDFDDTILSDFSKKDIKKENDDKSEEGEVLVEDLLKLSFMLKNDIDVKDFSTDNKELKTAITDQKTVSEFKDAKNVNDLLNIAKKNNINIKSFEFSTKESVPLAKDTEAVKSEDVFKMIDKKIDNSSKLVETLKNGNTNQENTLKNILSSLDIKEKTTNTSTALYHNDTTPAKINKTESKKEVFISSKHTVKTDIPKQNIEIVEVTKEVLTEEKSDKVQKNTQTVSKVQTSSINLKDLEKTFKTNDQKDDKKTFIKNSSKSSQKIQRVQPKNQQIQTIQIDQTNKTVAVDQKETDEKHEISSLEEKTRHDTRAEHTFSTHKVSVAKPKTDVKHTINTFAQDFKDQVESYKPPLMKVKMQLSPQGLGDVDVTMVNRGNNLHITVNSNQNTIAIFSQNQTEFKNSLINMGFSELNMSFNENGKNRDNSQNQKNKNSSTQSFEDENHEDSFEMTTPIYI